MLKVQNPKKNRTIESLSKKVLKKQLFGFAIVDIKVPEELHEKFSEMSPFFMLDEIPEIPEYMKEYLEATGRKLDPNSRKLLGVMEAKEIPLYTPLLEWYLEKGVKVTAYYEFILYKLGRPFDWFPDEVADARCKADQDEDQKINGDTAKAKGNTFYGKLIKDIARHRHTTFTSEESRVDQALRSPFFEDIKEIGDAYEISERKSEVGITRPYQCGIAVYQLGKLHEYEYIYMDTNSAYFAISGECLRDVVKPELLDEYDKEVHEWLATDAYLERTPWLFKLQFKGSK